jgi:hypothetical protein
MFGLDVSVNSSQFVMSWARPPLRSRFVTACFRIRPRKVETENPSETVYDSLRRLIEAACFDAVKHRQIAIEDDFLTADFTDQVVNSPDPGALASWRASGGRNFIRRSLNSPEKRAADRRRNVQCPMKREEAEGQGNDEGRMNSMSGERQKNCCFGSHGQCAVGSVHPRSGLESRADHPPLRWRRNGAARITAADRATGRAEH